MNPGAIRFRRATSRLSPPGSDRPDQPGNAHTLRSEEGDRLGRFELEHTQPRGRDWEAYLREAGKPDIIVPVTWSDNIGGSTGEWLQIVGCKPVDKAESLRLSEEPFVIAIAESKKPHQPGEARDFKKFVAIWRVEATHEFDDTRTGDVTKARGVQVRALECLEHSRQALKEDVIPPLKAA